MDLFNCENCGEGLDNSDVESGECHKCGACVEEEEVKYKATPWVFGTKKNGSIGQKIYSDTDHHNPIATLNTNTRMENFYNAEHIVKCVNSHEELKALVGELSSKMEYARTVIHAAQVANPAHFNADITQVFLDETKELILKAKEL